MEELANAIVNFDADGAKAKATDLLDKGGFEEVVEGIRRGLKEVGERYERKEYFLSDLIMAAALAEDIFEMSEPYLDTDDRGNKGLVLIGTVRGSVHGMGKSILKSILTSSGFKVHDLGVDVPPRDFVAKVKELEPDVLALSVGLTQALPSVKEVMGELSSAGVRDRVRVILGGNAASEERANELGVDAYGATAVEGLRKIESWASETE